MKRVILIDGNNILFRSYYATAYKGNILRNSKGFPTNALYGFMNMINKIIKEFEPSYIMVAFDKGKTFRHEKYQNYKDGRKETPDDLKIQFPAAKELCDAMGIKHFEVDNYEADDIIGTFSKEVDKDDDFIGTIISSDKDLLQLISNDVDVKLLKMDDFLIMNEKTFFDTYGIEPIKIIDLKALMGDSSDNIPGVRGIGEKTALKLLQEYKSLDGVYENIDKISKSVKEKLIKDKKNAYFSYELATIYKDVPLDTSLEKIKYNGYSSNYREVLEKYEFYSFLNSQIEKKEEEIEYKIIDSLSIDIKDDYAIYIEVNGNYNDRDVKGIAIYNKDNSIFIPKNYLKSSSFLTNGVKKYTYDLKKLLVSFSYLNIDIDKNIDDMMLISYLLNYNIKDDLSYLMNNDNHSIKFSEQLYKEKNLTIEDIAKHAILKAKYIYDNISKMKEKLDLENKKLYNDLELPLCYVLSDMEYVGVNINENILDNMGIELKEKIDNISKEIYDLAGVEFNISSPKQLGKILFQKLSIPYPKKIKDDNYSTSIDILTKLKEYDIVNKIIEHRTFSKLYTTYIISLKDYIKLDSKIHTNFNQTLTRTGRLSSSNPNLQNIPAKEEYGRLIRKAFIPSDNSIIISFDYSQIELRIFAHMANAENMIDAFKEGMDIHTKTAMDIYHVSKSEVTKKMRRNAKAVNFGIIYGISSFGLSEDLNIDVKEAKEFIENYLNTFPGIRDYMKEEIEEAKRLGYSKTLFGRKRYIEELKSSNFMIRSMGERMALNTPIQGTSADILKKAMIEIFNEFKKRNIKSKMIIQVHDELVIDTLVSEKDEVIKIVKEIMENTYKLNVPLKVDVNCGANWYEAK